MRKTVVFAGRSVPELTQSICMSLGMAPGGLQLSQFANGETNVKIMESIREKDVFIVQSGSEKINDSIMELLILINACKGGSANKITAVLPYFPYSRQSKKKSHRGAITARMLANLLHVAGVDHVVTIDLHASQMQGFFKCPVDNLHAEPLIARWIRHNVPNWREAVCVSKNAGGTKRVTSLADALKLNFGMVTTDRRRQHNLAGSTVLSPASTQTNRDTSDAGTEESLPPKEVQLGASKAVEVEIKDGNITSAPSTRLVSSLDGQMPSIVARRNVSGPSLSGGSPLSRAVTVPARLTMESADDEYTDERAREVIHGRLVHGHIVPDDYPSPTTSAMSNSMILNPGLEDDPMELSRASSFFATNPMENHALGGTHDAAPSSDEEDEPGRPGRKADATGEKMITLVGDVRGRTVFIVDDMIDKAGSWVAAAETVVKRGKATKVYCVATHGLFGGNSLEELEACECIDKIVVTNSFPLSRERAAACKKLVVLELAGLLSEAIRRNHYGESISALFQHASD